MGDGHNAAAAAIAEAIEQAWPGCETEQVDTMELRGPRFARAAQWAYGFQLARLPWSYAMSYAWLSRSPRRARSARASAGRFFGRRLGQELEQRRPDLVISTYPFGSAALSWLRTTKGDTTPSVTYIPAFHVHPMWAHEGIDLHFVMHDGAAEHALLPGFERSMRLGAPPVRGDFGTLGRAEARRSLGLADDEFVVLMTGGAWGIGGIAEGTRGLLGLGPPVHVVAVCGKNASLEAEMRDMAGLEGNGRLSAFGYVDNMPELMAAANVVVTNGAGQTVLEALCCGRPVVAFAPIAGHGTASTAELVKRDLAVEAKDLPAFVEQIRRLRTDPSLLSRLEHSAEAWAAGREMRLSLAEIEDLYLSRQPRSSYRASSPTS